MAHDETNQEKNAAAEEREEVLEAVNEDNGVDMSAVATPENSEVSSGTHIERSEEAAVEAAAELTDEGDETSTDVSEDAPKAAKAGKRSAKAQREAEEEEARVEAAA